MPIPRSIGTLLLLFAVLVSPACNEPKAPQKPASTDTLKSSIILQSSGISVKGAYLSDDQGTTLTEEVVDPGQRFILNILLDTGWVKQGGKSFIGAKEELAITSTHAIVASVEDLFADSAGVMDAEAARQIKLGGFINPGSQTKSDYTMSFQVWDKKGVSTVWGSYRVRLRDSPDSVASP